MLLYVTSDVVVCSVDGDDIVVVVVWYGIVVGKCHIGVGVYCVVVDVHVDVDRVIINVESDYIGICAVVAVLVI